MSELWTWHFWEEVMQWGLISFLLFKRWQGIFMTAYRQAQREQADSIKPRDWSTPL